MSKVLLLEADRVLAGNLGAYLRKNGYRVIWSGEPQTAIEYTDEHKPDVIVMDLMLGGHGGVEFLYELRSYPEWQDLPVIILSSVSGTELELAGTDLGQFNIAGFHYKPQTPMSSVLAAIGQVAQPIRIG